MPFIFMKSLFYNNCQNFRALIGLYSVHVTTCIAYLRKKDDKKSDVTHMLSQQTRQVQIRGSDSRLLLKNNQSRNGFCLQIKGEKVRITVSV